MKKTATLGLTALVLGLGACTTARAPVGTTYTPTVQEQGKRLEQTLRSARTGEQIQREDIGISREEFNDWYTRNSTNPRVKTAVLLNGLDGVYQTLDEVVATKELGYELNCQDRHLPSELASPSFDRKTATAFNYLHGLGSFEEIDSQTSKERVLNAQYEIKNCLAMRDYEIALAKKDSRNSAIVGFIGGLTVGYIIRGPGGGNGGGDSIGFGSNTNTGGPTF